MKAVRFTRRAANALKAHRNRADQIFGKIAAYGSDPASLANNVSSLKGEAALRLRVGDLRVIFEETETEIIVLDIAPRGSAYR